MTKAKCEKNVQHNTASDLLFATYVLGAPEELDPCLLLEALELLCTGVQVGVAFCQCLALWSKVDVMERVVTYAELLEKFKGNAAAALCVLYAIRAVLPWTLNGAGGTERIAANAPERVPPADCKATPLLHRLAQNNLVRVVVTERERVGGRWALVLDLGYQTV